jgi:hypothetical protein
MERIKRRTLGLPAPQHLQQNRDTQIPIPINILRSANTNPTAPNDATPIK